MGDHSCLSENVDCYSVDKVTLGSQVVVWASTSASLVHDGVCKKCNEISSAYCF